jgi:hypothetical protein
VMERVVKIVMTFYNSGGWESGTPRRVADNSGTYSMLQFWLERGGDMTKRCRKMKQR